MRCDRIDARGIGRHIGKLSDGSTHGLDRVSRRRATGASPFSTRLTVLGDTPAAFATS
jgi:hypothetical protein